MGRRTLTAAEKASKLAKNQLDMKMKNKVLEVISEKELKLQAELELLQVQKKAIINRIAFVQRSLDAELQKHKSKYEKVLKQVTNVKKNTCPSCGIVHVKSVPDPCWSKAFKGGDEALRLFDLYLRSNGLGQII